MSKINFKKIKNNRACPPSREVGSRRGFVLLYAVTLAAIFLSIALSVATIALKEIKFGTSAKDTNNAFYSADASIECALFYDKNSNFFVVSSTILSLTCNGNSATAVESSSGSAYWAFTLSQLNSDKQGCAHVTVDKTSLSAPTTTIIAKGYNNGGNILGVCTPSANSVERQLQTSY